MEGIKREIDMLQSLYGKLKVEIALKEREFESLNNKIDSYDLSVDEDEYSNTLNKRNDVMLEKFTLVISMTNTFDEITELRKLLYIPSVGSSQSSLFEEVGEVGKMELSFVNV